MDKICDWINNQTQKIIPFNMDILIFENSEKNTINKTR